MEIKDSNSELKNIPKSIEEQISDLKTKVCLLISTIKLQLEKMIFNYLPKESLFTIKKSMFSRVDSLKKQLKLVQQYLEDPQSEQNIQLIKDNFIFEKNQALVFNPHCLDVLLEIIHEKLINHALEEWPKYQDNLEFLVKRMLVFWRRIELVGDDIGQAIFAPK